VTLPYSEDPAALVSSERQRASLVRFARLLNKIASGHIPGASTVAFDTGDDGAVAAVGAVELASLENNDTITVGNVTFTAKTSGATGAVQFNLGASDAAAAAAFVVAANAHTSLTNVATASSVGPVITLTADVLGPSGNALQLSSSNGTRADVTAFTGGAATRTAFSF
jgi:hypothetical protein